VFLSLVWFFGLLLLFVVFVELVSIMAEFSCYLLQVMWQKLSILVYVLTWISTHCCWELMELWERWSISYMFRLKDMDITMTVVQTLSSIFFVVFYSFLLQGLLVSCFSCLLIGCCYVRSAISINLFLPELNSFQKFDLKS
jgi:hypothetical protein